jgi:hypothetical protein
MSRYTEKWLKLLIECESIKDIDIVSVTPRFTYEGNCMNSVYDSDGEKSFIREYTVILKIKDNKILASVTTDFDSFLFHSLSIYKHLIGHSYHVMIIQILYYVAQKWSDEVDLKSEIQRLENQII